MNESFEDKSKNEAKKSVTFFDFLDSDSFSAKRFRNILGAGLALLVYSCYDSYVAPHLGKYDIFANRSAKYAITTDLNKDRKNDIVITNQFHDTLEIYYGISDSLAVKK